MIFDFDNDFCDYPKVKQITVSVDSGCHESVFSRWFEIRPQVNIPMQTIESIRPLKLKRFTGDFQCGTDPAAAIPAGE